MKILAGCVGVVHILLNILLYCGNCQPHLFAIKANRCLSWLREPTHLSARADRGALLAVVEASTSNVRRRAAKSTVNRKIKGSAAGYHSVILNKLLDATFRKIIFQQPASCLSALTLTSV